MSLSMDEQRILAQIERQLAHDDPELAVRLSSFTPRRWRLRPATRRSRRPRRLTVVVTVVLVAAGLLAALLAVTLNRGQPAHRLEPRSNASRNPTLVVPPDGDLHPIVVNAPR